MKRSMLMTFFIGIALACMPGAARATLLAYDADSTGVTVTYRSFLTPLQPREFTLSAPVNGEVQTVSIHMGLLSVDLALTELAPGGRPCFNMQWTIKSIWLNPQKQEGVITLPFGHGGITNNRLQAEDPAQFDAKGVFRVRWFFPSSYEVQFGLPNLQSTIEAQTDDDRRITQVISRDNGNELVDVNLTFNPSIFLLPPFIGSKISFDLTVTPDSVTLPDETFEFNGTLPAFFGNYYFWFYRDK
jgi:hypothetical protein